MHEQRENVLIAQLKEIIGTSRHTTGEPTWHYQQAVLPVTQEELAQAEMVLGFALPALLRRIYLEVGNGGFGPGYGLFPLQKSPLSRHRPLSMNGSDYNAKRLAL